MTEVGTGEALNLDGLKALCVAARRHASHWKDAEALLLRRLADALESAVAEVERLRAQRDEALRVDSRTLKMIADEIYEHPIQTRTGNCACGQWVGRDPQFIAQHLAANIMRVLSRTEDTQEDSK